MSQSRQLAAIMFTDIVGYTAMMQQNEEKAVAVIKHYNSALEKWVTNFNGQVLNYYGDGSLCIFSSATDAVNCSLAVQKDLKSEPVVPLRIGLHIGEVFFEDAKALGDGVNVASRVQSLGQENTILVSEEIYDKIKNNPSVVAVSLGHFDFKNVGKSMEVFALTNEGLFVPQRRKMKGKLKKKNVQRRNIIAALSLIIVVVDNIFYLSKSL
jgi:class 3 adenylate cyclase